MCAHTWARFLSADGPRSWRVRAPRSCFSAVLALMLALALAVLQLGTPASAAGNTRSTTSRVRDAGQASGETGRAGRGRQLHQSSGTQAAEEEKDPATGCPLPKVNVAAGPVNCVTWKKVCIDHGAIVVYGNSRGEDGSEMWTADSMPQLDVTGLLYNLPSKYGIGDRYLRGAALHFPQLVVRPSSDWEEEPELRRPQFSVCTMPLLIFQHYPFNAAETFRLSFQKLAWLYERGMFNRHVTIVPGVPSGTRVPPYTTFWYGSLTDRAVISLSQLSARRSPDTPSNATWEGRHVRCFEQAVGCVLRHDQYGNKFYATGQHLVKHYMPQYLSQSAEFEERLFQSRQVRIPDDPSVLKVVFISRAPEHGTVGRTVLNEQELIERCNSAAGPDVPPPEWEVPYKKYFCFAHTFGENQLMDLWIMRRVDAIFGIHGAGLTNGLFMKPGGSVVEVRPFGFSGVQGWANMYMRAHTSVRQEWPWPIFWFGIDIHNETRSVAGAFETEAHKPHVSDNRLIKARDRHVIVTWHSLRHQLLNVACVGRTLHRYMSLRHSGASYMTDDLKQAEPRGHDRAVDRRKQRNFTDPDMERALAVKFPLNLTVLELATKPDQLPVRGDQ